MAVEDRLKSLVEALTQALLPACDCRSEAESQAWQLLAFVTGLSRGMLLANPVRTLTLAQQDQLAGLVARRVQERMPLQYLLGSVPFLDLTIAVRPPTLIPRPETEEWVAWLINQLQPVRHEPLRILDLCTGSGCIALALAQAFPRAYVVGVDIAPEAVALAQENARANGVSNGEFVVGDVASATLSLAPARFDLVVSNPPYITPDEFASLAPEVAAWEDKRALVASEHGLALYRALAKGLASWLDTQGILAKRGLPVFVCELGTDARSVESLFSPLFSGNVSLHADLQGVDRWLVGRI